MLLCCCCCWARGVERSPHGLERVGLVLLAERDVVRLLLLLEDFLLPLKPLVCEGSETVRVECGGAC